MVFAASSTAAVAIDSTAYTLPASGTLPAGTIPSVTLPSAYNPLANLEQQASKDTRDVWSLNAFLS